MSENTRKLAVIIPGIGYTKDKPILYYSSKLLKEMGYEILNVFFSGMPENIMKDDRLKLQAVQIAMEQIAEQLSDVKFSEYEDVVFVGKSLGTIAAAGYVTEKGIDARQIWYTPLEKTFSYGSSSVLAFIGDADPWSDINVIRSEAEKAGTELVIYEACNHSLESGDILKDIETLEDSLKKIWDFL